jgi:hypothetical protein
MAASLPDSRRIQAGDKRSPRRAAKDGDRRWRQSACPMIVRLATSPAASRSALVERDVGMPALAAVETEGDRNHGCERGCNRKLAAPGNVSRF